MNLKNILKNLKIKDIVAIGIIVFLALAYFFKKGNTTQTDVDNAVKIEKLQNDIKAKSDSVKYLVQVEKKLNDSLTTLKAQKDKIVEKTKLVYRDIPAKNAIVESLDTKHLEEFFVKWDYENPVDTTPSKDTVDIGIETAQSAAKDLVLLKAVKQENNLQKETIQNLEEQSVVRDNIIKTKQETIDLKDAIITDKDGIIDTKNSQINKLDKKLKWQKTLKVGGITIGVLGTLFAIFK